MPSAETETRQGAPFRGSGGRFPEESAPRQFPDFSPSPRRGEGAGGWGRGTPNLPQKRIRLPAGEAGSRKVFPQLPERIAWNSASWKCSTLESASKTITAPLSAV